MRQPTWGYDLQRPAAGEGRPVSASEIWVVDDDRSIRWVLEKALNREGVAVRVFDSGDHVGRQRGAGGSEVGVGCAQGIRGYVRLVELGGIVDERGISVLPHARDNRLDRGEIRTEIILCANEQRGAFGLAELSKLV